MAIHIQVLKDWVEKIVEYDPDCSVWVDEGGLGLESGCDGYIEVGGKADE
jgi:hypothetical protein